MTERMMTKPNRRKKRNRKNLIVIIGTKYINMPNNFASDESARMRDNQQFNE